VNVCRDAGRSRRRRSAVISDGEDVIEKAEQKSSGSNPHRELHAEQCRQMLYRAVETLPEKERLAFVLRDIDGMSTAEAAAALGSSEATIRSQISSARLKFENWWSAWKEAGHELCLAGAVHRAIRRRRSEGV
jgi:RNA polymerase sigma-70 factor (ECF subfamily)